MSAFNFSRVVTLFALVTFAHASASAEIRMQNESNSETNLQLCSNRAEPMACTAVELQRDFTISVESGSKNDLLRVIKRLKSLASLDNVEGYSPLEWAVFKGRSDVVSLLLQKGADPLAVDAHGRFVLYNAIASAYSLSPELPSEVVKCVRMVLEHASLAGRLPPKPPLDASIVFYGGARKPNLELLKLFVKYGAEPNRKGWYWYDGSPLDAAIIKNNLEAVRIMIAPGSHITQQELDEKAFGALMKQNTELLEIFHSAGANPKRYVDLNPKILFDAARPGGSVQALEFLLKNGANPNTVEHASSKRTLIFATGFEPEKMTLLFKYGADPNVKDGYTVLANILFHYGTEISVASATPDQASRRYHKVSLVKLLLEHGADPNIDNGGWGQWGALGLTRREDKDVIDLLVKRGATLRYEVGRSVFPQVREKLGDVTPHDVPGPITIAVALLERDDLALALLARNDRVDASDKLALLEATRRGWGEVAAALTRAGADPNIADAKGLTPLTMAERRRDRPLIQMLVAAGAKPSSSTGKSHFKIDAGGEFETAVATEIDDVVFFDPPRFSPGRVEKTSFAFYGKGVNQFEEIECERSVKLTIIANMNIAGEIRAGVCNKDAKRIRELAQAARSGFEALVNSLVKADVKPFKADLAALGWIYDRQVGPKASEIHYFPVIAIGHGILSVPTTVLVSKKQDQAIIIQVDVMNLCGENRSMQSQTPLCSDTKGALTDIALRLFARFGEK